MPVTTRQMARKAPMETHSKIMDKALKLTRELTRTDGPVSEAQRAEFTLYMKALEAFQKIPNIKKNFLMHTVVNDELLKWMRTVRI